jgi:hypothetical protein
LNSSGSKPNNEFEEPYVGMPIANMNRSVQKKSYCTAVNSCPLAMAYVPWQCWEQPYEPNVALKRGTIFPCLDLPWEGWRY